MAGSQYDLKELARLEGKCEKLLEKAGAFDLEACYVLRDIRNTGAYLARHSSWDTYCQVRWGMSSGPANTRLRAADVMDALADGGPYSALPSSVAVASELFRGLRLGCGRRGGRGGPVTKGESAEIRGTWEDVIASGQKPTLALVRGIVAKRRVAGANGKALDAKPRCQVRAFFGPTLPAEEVARRLAALYPPATIDALIGELLTRSRNQRAMAA